MSRLRSAQHRLWTVAQVCLAILAPQWAAVRELRRQADRIPELWYEDGAGRFLCEPDYTDAYAKPQAEPLYMVARFALELRESVLRIYPDRSAEVCSSNRSFSDRLATALVRAGLTASQAIKVAGIACERCTNALLHEFVRNEGYPAGCAEWRAARTKCWLCEPCICGGPHADQMHMLVIDEEADTVNLEAVEVLSRRMLDG